MTGFIVRRLGQMLLALFGVSIIVFALIHIVPGDPVRIALGTRFDPDIYAALVERAGLDRPILEQYFSWLAGAVQGDLGVSFRSGQPVTGLVLERLPATLTLAGASLFVAVAVGIPLGVISAVRSGSRLDYAASAASQVGVSIPDFWAGIMYILLFSLTLGWLPPSGYVSIFEDPLGWLSHLIMPAMAVGLVSASIIFRFVRSAVLEALNQDYTRMARAKGLSRRRVLWDHVLPNAWIPIVTVIGLQLGFMLGGVIVVEIVFAWPGIGRLAFLAVGDRDFTVLQGTVLYIAFVFLLINLVVDILYGWLDPRIRYD
ncbi:MAG TPA: ABC transporter permease [Acidimicrobiia bacterium]|nr:ABC transporter permease [Acidimicrobiia bacterium]